MKQRQEELSSSIRAEKAVLSADLKEMGTHVRKLERDVDADRTKLTVLDQHRGDTLSRVEHMEAQLKALSGAAKERDMFNRKVRPPPAEYLAAAAA